MGGLRNRSGQILVQGVGKGGRRPLRLHDSTGRVLLTVGREGQGPGEFRSIMKIGFLPGDSIWAYDQLLRGLSVFTPSGEFVRRTQLDGITTGCEPLGALADASVVVKCRNPLDASSAETTCLRFPADGGSPVRALADTAPFAAANGYLPAAAYGAGQHNLYRAAASAYEVSAFTTDGKLLRSTRIVLEPHVPTAKDIQHYHDLLVQMSLASGMTEDRARAHIRTLPVPDRVSVWARLVEDPAGNLWAQEFTLLWDQPRRWFVFDPHGSFIGNVETPPKWNVLDIGRDYMLVANEDEEETQLVEVHRILKPSMRRHP
jgi:hypothetical protein